MTTSPDVTGKEQPRDAAYWARQIPRLKVLNAPSGALNLNVEGREATSPLQGFGQMWQKTFRIRLHGASVKPGEVIQTWKEEFSTFWLKWNRFYAPKSGIAPGEVALINMLIPGDVPVGVPISTGVFVLYADDESFTFMNPQGHMFAGWITFSAYEEDGCTVAQVQLLVRASDPVYEIGFRLGASKSEDKFWRHTLKSLAEHFGVDEQVEKRIVCVDPKVQWSQFWNIWHNSAIRTVIYTMLTPLRWTFKRFQG